MSILKKPYEITVWEDEYVTNTDGTLSLQEVCIGLIGSDKMMSQSRAIEPNLVRNVNGTKKLTFKMYKRYVDNITGEEVENPFSGWLVSERKIKLYYNEKWYDFIIKNIDETSATYLYTYTLEDALVQELSKNGFNVTFDAESMNNLGNAKELAEKALEDTDWNVESETFVQTVDEALVYIKFPNHVTETGYEPTQFPLIHQVKDQQNDNLNSGVDDNTTLTLNKFYGQTVLAFYSCCKNKPHRFQFIYSNKGYNKNENGEYAIARKDDRTIIEPDCQYYIDFDNPEQVYVDPEERTGTVKQLGLWLPMGFEIGYYGIDNSQDNQNDSYLSYWYRGKRYGYSEQSEYVPLLDKYCYKVTKKVSQIPLISSGEGKNLFSYIRSDYDVADFSNLTSIKLEKDSPYFGIYFQGDFTSEGTYIVEYTLTIQEGNLSNVGGHNLSFSTYMEVETKNSSGEIKKYSSTQSKIDFNETLNESTEYIKVKAKYNYKHNSADPTPYIFIQPDREIQKAGETIYIISDLSISYEPNYLYYVDSEYVSPTVIQNFITNYKFESSAGWTATSSSGYNSETRPVVEAVYGRFVSSKFSSIIDEFQEGTYAENKGYLPYLKVTFKNENQFLLNSGLRDNRSIIKNLTPGEQFVLDCEILGADGQSASNFSCSIGEYIYDSSSGVYRERIGSANIIGETTGNRTIFTVNSSSYTEENFKKNSKFFLKITPSISTSGQTYYIKKIALYRLVRNDEGVIIEPDYDTVLDLETDETGSAAAKNFVDNCVLNNRYNYFNKWLIDPSNPNRVLTKESLPVQTKDQLDYVDFAPVYNEGAEKIRSITEKESNYFNILQKIAETVEGWLSLEVTRNDNGAITSKTAKFKNYAGNDNYANFRYGVNLKDIQRTFASNNIVTKLLVKNNSNELAKNGFCTIQRAGANPTGENYIYDFQYYQNIGIMNTEDYLLTNYYIDDAKGPDGELWNGEVTEQNDYNLNGYFLRLKKINDTLEPIKETLIGLETDLLKKKALLESMQAQYDAALSGIEETRENFMALTGLYPEEAQQKDIKSISPLQGKLTQDNSSPLLKDLYNGTELEEGEFYQCIVPKQKWWEVPLDSQDENGDGSKIDQKIKFSNNEAVFDIVITNKREKTREIIPSNVRVLQSTKNSIKIRKAKHQKYGGLSIKHDWQEGQTYLLTYELQVDSGVIKNIGCHHTAFADYEKTIQQSCYTAATYSDDSTNFYGEKKAGAKFLVTIKGKFNKDERETDQDDLWIQPNRGVTDKGCICTISNIRLYKLEDGEEGTKAFAEPMQGSCYLNAIIEMKSGATLYRSFQKSFTLPANTTSLTVTVPISSIDFDRSDIKGYLDEYTTYLEKRDAANAQVTLLTPEVAALEQEISQIKQNRERYLQYKSILNKMFFSKYSRFILEGTWINEEYTDDDKYFADAQSVLYNSCYPQVTYNINTVSLKGLPGYEMIDFDIGDKTNVIDEKFFGSDYQEEVVITEISENLDDPSKNSIKVQNFKNQFQDLFQKITATVQQTQYNVGSYEKGDALVSANAASQAEFITNALNRASSVLSSKNNEVEQTDAGIIITDKENRNKQLLINSAGILLGTPDEDGENGQVWRVGLSSEGISANIITAGTINTGKIQIMSGDSPTFKWDAYGLSAYDATWANSGEIKTISGINSKKFVRFDKHGIYGIDNVVGVDGTSWVPSGEAEIAEKATFALTWEGLMVTANTNSTEMAVLKIGKDASNGDKILSVYKKNIDNQTGKVSIIPTFEIDKNGNVVSISGNIGSWNIGTAPLYNTDPTSLIYTGALWSTGVLRVEEYNTSTDESENNTTTTVEAPYMTILRAPTNEDHIAIGSIKVTKNGDLYQAGNQGFYFKPNGKASIRGWKFDDLSGLRRINDSSKTFILKNALYRQGTDFLTVIAAHNSNAQPAFGIVDWSSKNKGYWRFGVTGVGHVFGTSIYSSGQIWAEKDSNKIYISPGNGAESDFAIQILRDSNTKFGVKYNGEATIWGLTNTTVYVNSGFELQNNKTNKDDKIQHLTLNPRSEYNAGATPDFAIRLWDGTTTRFSVRCNGNVYSAYTAAASTSSTDSDARVKNSIKDMSKSYEILFDELHPRIFKYNEGSSNRIHSGYIVQEVLEAMSKANLTTQEFAAVCAPEVPGERDVWGLRYDEFVSINTWQIQKLKPRMTAAEEKIIQLEQEIRALREELAQLNR